MNALVVYYSKTGRTRQMAWEIDRYLKNHDLNSKMISVYDVQPEDFAGTDMVLLGCWTHGLFFIFQHPDKTWREYAAAFPDLKGRKVGFFTTYKTATGSMFRRMYKNLKDRLSEPVTLQLKSRNGKLSDKNKVMIDEFIGAYLLNPCSIRCRVLYAGSHIRRLGANNLDYFQLFPRLCKCHYSFIKMLRFMGS